jgi:hypothetical protein
LWLRRLRIRIVGISHFGLATLRERKPVPWLLQTFDFGRTAIFLRSGTH